MQCFILTEVSDCGFLIVVTSSFVSSFFCVFFFVCADYEGNTEGVHTTDYWNMFTIPTSSLNV